LNALNPWLSTNLANADNTEDNMKIIAQAVTRIADVLEKQEQRALREEHRNIIRAGVQFWKDLTPNKEQQDLNDFLIGFERN